MKKLSKIMIITLLSVFVFASCEKEEGVFNPKQKIHKTSSTYEEMTEVLVNGTWQTVGDDKYAGPSEVWVWDGNLLSSIRYYDGINMEYEEHYQYDKDNVLIRVSNDEGDAYEYVYGDSQLKEIDYFYGNELEGRIMVSHDGKKISKLTMQIDYAKAFSALRHILPAGDSKNMKKAFAQLKKNSKNDEEMYINFEWDGDNVSKITFNDEGEIIVMMSFTYDKKKNPYYGLFDITRTDDMLDITDFSGLSKNNVTSLCFSEDGETYMEDFTYTYDGKYPVAVVSKIVFEDEEEGYSYRSSVIVNKTIEYTNK